LLRDAGGRPVLVGGCVRDALMQVPVLDVDVEVYGLGTRQVEAALRKEFGIITVGAAFGVTKLKDFPVDVSVPRRENRTGAKHTDFDVQADPTMTPKDAAERRDFTLNAIMWDPFTGEVLDPWAASPTCARSVSATCRPSSPKTRSACSARCSSPRASNSRSPRRPSRSALRSPRPTSRPNV
jgi:tRNA nucleotidyltransferase (CCA-adding enzyme)